jgi:hypothetical protein
VNPRQYYLDPAQLLAACQHVSRTARCRSDTLLQHLHREIQRTITTTDWSIVKSHALQGEGFHINLDLEVIPGLEHEAEIFVDVYVDPAILSQEVFKTYYMPPFEELSEKPSRKRLHLLQGGRCAKKGG